MIFVSSRRRRVVERESGEDGAPDQNGIPNGNRASPGDKSGKEADKYSNDRRIGTLFDRHLLADT